jgi:hypothetical protein
MLDIFITKTKTLPNHDDDGTHEETFNYVARLQNGVLLISAIKKNENNEDIEVLVMEQPWKCNPDGSRAAWVDDADAEQWLEAVKHDLLG